METWTRRTPPPSSTSLTPSRSPMPVAQLAYRRTVRLSPGCDYYHRSHCLLTNPDEVNSAISTAFTVDADDYTPVLLCLPFLDTLDGPIKAELGVEAVLSSRTVQVPVPRDGGCRLPPAAHDRAAGVYRVRPECDGMGIGEGVNILVQSDKKDAGHLDDRIENFLRVFEEKHFDGQLQEQEHRGQQDCHCGAADGEEQELGRGDSKIWNEVSRAR